MLLSWYDLTTGKKANFPALPEDGVLTEERPQSSAEMPILGSLPQVQIAAVGVRKLTMSLFLWGADGVNFYRNYVEPAYGVRDAFKPHLIQIAWGKRSIDTFAGYAIGQPPTKINLGERTGQIFGFGFDLTLTEVLNNAPVALAADGTLVAVSYKTHVVRRGDTLASIARRYGVTMVALAEANGGAPPFRLAPGSTLLIPESR